MLTSCLVPRTGLETACFFETHEQICRRVYREIRPRAPLPEIEVRFCAFANANSFIRLEGRKLCLRVSDLLQNAPAPVFEALAAILISKLYRKSVPARYSDRYRRYLNRREVRTTLDAVRQQRGRKRIAGPKGSVYDLEEIFEDLNFRYFFGLMSRPALGWSLRLSRVTLGHYDHAHNTIVISRLLDRPTVPRLAVEYVVFHEMLHLRHPVEHHASRRCVHTQAFKEAEKQFERLAEAKALLKTL
jgi:hypothetical protein